MKDVQLLLLLILIIDIVVGIVVYFTNRKRVVNQCYVELATLVALWQLSCLMVVGAKTIETGTLYIRVAYLFTAFIPTACFHLRSSIIHPEDSFLTVFFKNRTLLLSSIAIGILCFSNYFLTSVEIPPPELRHTSLVEPKHGPALILYTIYLISAGLYIIFILKNDIAESKGVQREELCFIVLGASFALVVGSILSLVTPYIVGSFRYIPFSNALSIIILTSVIAYGIATRKILGITTLLRKATAYILMAIYLTFVYFAVWKTLSFILPAIGIDHSVAGHLVATLAIAFTMAPMNGRLQSVANKLISSKTMDIPTTMKKSGEIFQSVTTITALFKQYSELLQSALGSDEVTIISGINGTLSRYSTTSRTDLDSLLLADSPISRLISTTKDPVCIDELARSRSTETSAAVIKQLSELDINLVIGIFSKNGLSGLVIFGPRLGGRIYDKVEQDALQVLCNQLAVALENAQMYTEMQDSKIRNEIMLDQLVSGVIVANTDRQITLINHEAQRILGLTEASAMGKRIDLLPGAIFQALESTLEKQSGARNVDATLTAKDEKSESLSIRMGSAYLFGHDEKPMGALLVFTDMTELKSLEEQVRRSDQLSSVGTLAAGMAHEIKNPLVTIKTFTQLLPKRYNDEDFRQDFSSLVAHEVARIDGIVNELLSFSKPAKPHLIPMNLHETIGQTQKLIHEQLAQKNIVLTNKLQAATDAIFGDAKLLSQALVNLNLNAIEAIDHDGLITVSTTNCSYRFANGNPAGKAITRQCIRLQITDTGKGIEKESLQKIFDPFFTNKSEGTGMGLSVSHGIITEHHGVIEVESEPGHGTTFYVYIPLLEENAA